VATLRALLVCSPPTKCHRTPGHLAALAAASWSRFSPDVGTPEVAQQRTSLAGRVLVTATRSTSSRAPGGGTRGRQPLLELGERAASSAARSAHRRGVRALTAQPHDAGVPPGAAVPPVGEEALGLLERAAADGADVGQPGAAQHRRGPARQVDRVGAAAGRRAAAGTAASTCAASSGGTS
jgi:hypothetical protein